MSLTIRPTNDRREFDLDKPYLRLHATIAPHTGPIYDRDGNEVGVIHACEIRDPAKSRGLGDTIAKATSAVGIKPCGGCKKRQAKLNDMMPYKSDGDES